MRQIEIQLLSIYHEDKESQVELQKTTCIHFLKLNIRLKAFSNDIGR
jgi:hypothetical protein